MPDDAELCYMTAAKALAAFGKKTLSPVELMQAVIDRSEAVNPKVNAFTATFYERALEKARKAEAIYMGGAASRGRLKASPLRSRISIRSQAKSPASGQRYSRTTARPLRHRPSSGCWKPAQSCIAARRRRSLRLASLRTAGNGA